MVRFRWQWPKDSIRVKLTVSVIIMTVPLVAMLLYNNFYAIGVVRGQVSDSYKNSLGLYMKQIDLGLNDADLYMNSIVGNGYDLLLLSKAKTDNDYYSSKLYIYNKLGKDIALYRSVESFFVYEEQRQDYMYVTSTQDITSEKYDSIQNFIVELIHKKQISKGTKRWQYYRIGAEYYLVNIVQFGDAYLGAWVRTDTLSSPLQTLDLGKGGRILFSNDKGEPLSDTSLAPDGGTGLRDSLHEYYVTGKQDNYLIAGSSSTKGNMDLVALIPNNHILANLPYLQRIIWFITVIAMFFIPLGIYSMRRSILIPLTLISRAMKRVRGGDWSVQVEMGKSSSEFKLLGDSFNSMMTEIQTLRVNVFEEQLNKQREELQRLQLQVNPHFFLNALNIVYNLAKVKNYDLIQEMTLSLIHYFRYMFRSNTSFVKLKDELEHTRNYLRIQDLRFRTQLTWNVEAPDYLTEAPVPPLIIQSFVENAIKHAVTLEQPVHIEVRIGFQEGDSSGSRMSIRIQDTGQGFEERILKDLQAGRSIVTDQGEHTGIWNAQRRIKLLYGDTASIHFSNDEASGGAVITFDLPANLDGLSNLE